MIKEKMFIPLVLGTNRKGRASENVTRRLFGKMSEREEIETKLFDVRDFDWGRKLDYAIRMSDSKHTGFTFYE